MLTFRIYLKEIERTFVERKCCLHSSYSYTGVSVELLFLNANKNLVQILQKFAVARGHRLYLISYRLMESSTCFLVMSGV